MTRKKALIVLTFIVVLAAAIGASFLLARKKGVAVNVEALRARDLEAIVSASGKIQPKTQVNISANTTGRVTRLAVDEGERVKQGQFLLEIDPRSLAGQLERGQASVAAAKSSLDQSQTGLAQARANLDLAQQNLKRQQELWSQGLTTKETLEQAQNTLAVRQADVKTRQQEIQMRQEQIKQEQASLETTQYSLNQVIINSPIDGLVTRRNIEQGETAVMGTMNNAGTVLLTIADMSMIQAEVEVDETDIPAVAIGQSAKVTIDAVPDRTFKGHVTEIGNSPIQQTGAQTTAGSTAATNFKVVVTIDEPVPDVRPGFTCSAEITTATRNHVTSVPIQALTVREMLFDANGTMIHQPPPRSGTAIEPTVSASNDPPPGQTRKEVEGVFVLQNDRAVFTPIKVGIAGERYFEVLSGAKPGDQVIIGPFASVRELPDGAQVKIAETASTRTAAK